MQGKRRKIDEIVHWYIEEILLKFDTAIRSLDEAREVYCLFFNVLCKTKYIEFESEAHKRWKNLKENSKIWAHSSDG